MGKVEFAHVTLKEDEKVVTVVHRSAVTLLHWWLFGAACFGVAFYYMFWLFKQGMLGEIAFWGLIVLGVVVFVRTYAIWMKDRLVVTNQRVVRVLQEGFFKKVVRHVVFENIKTVVSGKRSVFESLFRQGSVFVKGKEPEFSLDMPHISHPERLQELILEIRQRRLEKKKYEHSYKTAKEMFKSLKYLGIDDLERLKRSIQRRLREYVSEEDEVDEEDE